MHAHALTYPRPTRTARRLLTPSIVAVTRTANGTTGSLTGSTTPLTTQQSAATRLARAARRKPWSSRNEAMTRKRTAMTKQLVTSRTVSMYLLLPMPTTPSAVDRSPDGAHVKCGHSHLYRPLTPSSHYSKPCVPRVGSAGGEAARLGRPLGGCRGVREGGRSPADDRGLVPGGIARAVAGRRHGEHAGLGAGATARVELEVPEAVVDDGAPDPGVRLDDVGMAADDD